MAREDAFHPKSELKLKQLAKRAAQGLLKLLEPCSISFRQHHCDLDLVLLENRVNT